MKTIPHGTLPSREEFDRAFTGLAPWLPRVNGKALYHLPGGRGVERNQLWEELGRITGEELETVLWTLSFVWEKEKP